MKKSVPFVIIVLIALGIAVINIHPPITVLFGLFVGYGLSGYGVLAQNGGQQTSVISTSTDEPDERAAPSDGCRCAPAC